MTDDEILHKSTGVMQQVGLTADQQSLRIALGGAEDGKQVFLDMPAAAFPGFVVQMVNTLNSLIAGKVLPGFESQPGYVAQRWKVGRNDDPRVKEMVALVLDEGLQTEVFRLFTDLDALRIADAIEDLVFLGLSPDDQRKLVETVQAQKKKPAIILPPGVRRN